MLQIQCRGVGPIRGNQGLAAGIGATGMAMQGAMGDWDSARTAAMPVPATATAAQQVACGLSGSTTN